MVTRKIALVPVVPRAEAAVLAALRHEVAHRRPERAGEDVGDPEGQHGATPHQPVGDGGHGDECGEEEGRAGVAEVEALGDEVAGRRAEGEGEEDGRPVEGLTAGGADRVDRQRVLDAIPTGERRRQRHHERRRGDLEADAEVVDQLVGEQGADHADGHHRHPVDGRHVAAGTELQRQHDHEEGGHHVGGVGQAEIEVDRQVVGRRLAHRGGEHLDDPEPDGDLGDLVEEVEAVVGGGVGRRGRGVHALARYGRRVRVRSPLVQRKVNRTIRGVACTP